jgi:hypothetical protein
MLVACIFTIKVNKLIYKYIYEYLVNEMLKSARYDIDRAEIVVQYLKRLPQQPFSQQETSGG